MPDTVAFQRLADTLRGELIHRDHPDYHQARRLWNGMVDRYPAAIARCAGTADVIAALDFARNHQLPLSVRAGGHGVAGKALCDDGLVIDLQPMHSVEVDPRTRTARVQAGARLQHLDAETQAFGLAVTAGVDSRTGVAGLTLGGGHGYLARYLGLTIDNLVSAQVVLADGRTVTASESEHPDLFWALRGGGGNFGIVTSFEFRLAPVGPQVMTAQAYHSMATAGEALRAYRDFMAKAPDEVGVYALFINVPPVDPFPAELHGTTGLALVACHGGALEEGEETLQPLTTAADPFLGFTAPMPYTDLQQAFNAGAPDGARFYFKSHYVETLTDAAIDTLVERIDPLPGPFTSVGFEPLGGAVARVDPTATAFPHRSADFSLGIWVGWDDPAHDEAAISWARELHSAMVPHATGGSYSNYLDRDDDRHGAAAFGANLRRLQQVKREYDPDNVFAVNPALAPSSG